ncbi:MAG TPA: CRISPR system precrRNA processing endoribonuclease RAMP protein Cas6 [Smithellaceae bacterium]|nr:CRISPR system precrRNA processing endoribonuclease RAMP protein Cas6 [Smithellaceae bacterium]HRS89007.1 CRISPR system precrRNA processing endoribonuclease RAMP protein Cas6 [Smithellaceae bacterium]HRV25623.1 CRISPR system precrRNA processing endoribonuclease RAMP protein Cas6 [Smithellaceae bacterium]
MKYGRYTFTCLVKDEAILPPYKGSTLRGIFGHALKKVVCALKKLNCADCLLADRCIYPTVFEIPAKREETTGRRRIAHPPHPYVIEPPPDNKTSYLEGDKLDFSLILFGAACDNLAYFIYAFEQIGSNGIGKRIDGKGGTFSLQEVCSQGDVVYGRSDRKICKPSKTPEITGAMFSEETGAGPFSIEVELVTPLRLKYQNGLKADLPFDVLTRAMLRRISSLFEYHGECEPALDYRGLVARAKNVAVKESHIGWYDWRRYSNRQEQAMMMGGMVGKIIYENVPGEYLPLLRFCELAHLGKQTTFGLGRIQVQTSNT